MDRYRSILDTPLNPTFQNAAESSLLRTFRHILCPFRNICNMVPLRKIFSTYVCYSVSVSLLFLFFGALYRFRISFKLSWSAIFGKLPYAICYQKKQDILLEAKLRYGNPSVGLLVVLSVGWSVCLSLFPIRDGKLHFQRSYRINCFIIWFSRCGVQVKKLFRAIF